LWIFNSTQRGAERVPTRVRSIQILQTKYVVSLVSVLDIVTSYPPLPFLVSAKYLHLVSFLVTYAVSVSYPR
jgi:hypothetical protein